MARKQHKDNTEEVYGKIESFLSGFPKDASLLDDILAMGSMGGFYPALDFFQIISLLNVDYPELISEPTKIGKTFQNREIKAFRIGMIGQISRVQVRQVPCPLYWLAPFERSFKLNHDSQDYPRADVRHNTQESEARSVRYKRCADSAHSQFGWIHLHQ